VIVPGGLERTERRSPRIRRDANGGDHGRAREHLSKFIELAPAALEASAARTMLEQLRP
jgi:hypothetical protein